MLYEGEKNDITVWCYRLHVLEGLRLDVRAWIRLIQYYHSHTPRKFYGQSEIQNANVRF